jgi:hypothetical protein
LIGEGFTSQVLDADGDANTVADFLDAHLFQDHLVALHQVAAIYMVG